MDSVLSDKFHVNEDIPSSHPVSAFAEIWKKLRGDKELPYRKDFHPSLCPRLLTHVSVMNREAPDRYVYALIGDEMQQLIGGNYTGQSLEALLEPSEWRLRLDRMNDAMDNHKMVTMMTRVPHKERDHVTVASGYFPFRAEPDQLFIVATRV